MSGSADVRLLSRQPAPLVGDDVDGGGGCCGGFHMPLVTVDGSDNNGYHARKRLKTTPMISSSALLTNDDLNNWNGGSTYSDLAQEMNKLSVEEREKVYEDVHGVASIQEEAPPFIAKALQELQSSILSTPAKDRRT